MARTVTSLTRFNMTSLALGRAFLYLPIVILVIYSFNASRLVTVWGGWSLHWYRELLQDAAMLNAAWASLRIAVVAATVATVMGTMAAVALTRYGRFRGRLLFSGMVYAPLVMPEVITGLSLLLLFVALGIDRGFWTVAAAHTTLTMCFVTVIVHSRLVSFDRSLDAIAYTNKGQVAVKVSEDNGNVKVEVMDSGIGIPSEDLPRLFEDFFRASNVSAKGTGLGLSISKRIVEAHGGRIWAESPCPETKKGSKFSFTLPKRTAVLADGTVNGNAGRPG